MTQQPTAPPLADRIAHAIDAIQHVAGRGLRDAGESMRRARDVLIGIVAEVVSDRDDARAEVERLKAELAKAQQQPEPVAVPSDEEIRTAIERADSTTTRCAVGYLTEAVEMIAKRIGVKL